MKKFGIVLVGIVVVGALAAAMSAQNTQGEARVVGAILPHHNVVGNHIDAFYEEIANLHVERVILISTNHFNTGYYYIQSTDRVEGFQFDEEILSQLEEQKIGNINPAALGGEHGLTVHFDRIKKAFPNAELVPLVLKWKTPQKNLDRLIDLLRSYNLEETVIIASIDFTHYTGEEGALRNDERTMAWLQSWEDGIANTDDLEEYWSLEKSLQFDTEISTALDSPETLYVFTNLIPQPQDVEIWKRTSSASIFNLDDPMQNTSHLFVKVR